MSNDGRRALRVAELVRGRFADAVRREIDDPGLATLVISDVSISADLSVVDIRVRFMGVEDERERLRLLTRLRRALPRLRRVMLPGLGLRRAPQFRLHHDEGRDAAQRVEELLREIADEKPKSGEGD